MKNLTAYAIFVMQASEAGQEIEFNDNGFVWEICEPEWHWGEWEYRIKLPKGWEYVIEDGDIAFRSTKKGEWYLCRNNGVQNSYSPRQSSEGDCDCCPVPIIRMSK
jgi:hypothetical protein